MVVEEKENGGVLPIHKFHIEMKIDFYLGIDSKTSTLESWKFGCPNLKCHNIILFIRATKRYLKQVPWACPSNSNPPSKK